jgi:hypothetical protein
VSRTFYKSFSKQNKLICVWSNANPICWRTIWPRTCKWHVRKTNSAATVKLLGLKGAWYLPYTSYTRCRVQATWLAVLDMCGMCVLLYYMQNIELELGLWIQDAGWHTESRGPAHLTRIRVYQPNIWHTIDGHEWWCRRGVRVTTWLCGHENEARNTLCAVTGEQIDPISKAFLPADYSILSRLTALSWLCQLMNNISKTWIICWSFFLLDLETREEELAKLTRDWTVQCALHYWQAADWRSRASEVWAHPYNVLHWVHKKLSREWLWVDRKICKNPWRNLYEDIMPMYIPWLLILRNIFTYFHPFWNQQLFMFSFKSTNVISVRFQCK